MKSIKLRLLRNLMFIVVITVLIMDLFFINAVKKNYYSNLKANLLSQIKISSNLYLRYFSDTSLHDNVLTNVDTFWKQTTAQVEIIDSSGNVLMDSIGVKQPSTINSDDVRNALNGKMGYWIGTMKYTDNKVMAVSYPLRSQERIVGAIRFITSLYYIDNEINEFALISIIFSAIVILMFSIISLLMANSIIGPLREVTAVAAKMATGNYKVESQKIYNDEIGKLSDTLNYMAKEILVKEELKNDFISSVSHELRTPLTSIKGWAITLRECYDDKAILEDGLDIIENESDRLTKMVEELLDFSKFVAGKIKIEYEYINVAELMEHINKQMEPRAKRENIELVVEYNLSTPMIYADPNRLKQIFINLLDNAFRFSNSGGIINFTAISDNKNIVFIVKDNGCGISEDELPKVKEKFYKGKSSKSKNGIGLSICDEIVKLMNGQFEIKSEIDKFTEITITIPLQESKL